METIFTPGTEILIAAGPRDIVQILEELPADRRLTIAANARTRLLREHTPDHRARQLEAYYHEAMAHRQSMKSSSMHAIELEGAT
jgi:spore maturation protein CgeB